MAIKHNKSEAGVAILISILLVGVLLSMVLSLSAIFIPKTHEAADIKNSVSAAYAAESALEWCFYQNQYVPTPSPAMGNQASFVVTPPDCSGKSITAVGSYRGVNRTFQINF